MCPEKNVVVLPPTVIKELRTANLLYPLAKPTFLRGNASY